MSRIRWRCGYVNFSAVYLLPYIRVGKVFGFIGWLRFEVGFWTERKR